MFDFLKNTFLNRSRYKTHSEAVIVSCFYNPQNSPYRLLAFQKWYHSIKHLNHRIIECLIGPDAKSQLPKSPFIRQVNTDNLLWHKETLINRVVSQLPEEFKYVFWVDADVLFTNDNWLVDAVKALEDGANIVQPWEYCIHLERNQTKPGFDVEAARRNAGLTNRELDKKKRLWRGFAANYVTAQRLSADVDYDRHGHVGFAWGARRAILQKCPLYDRALIGGADHIIAHAAAGQIPHSCIQNGFGDNYAEVEEWSNEFFAAVRGRIQFVTGDLYHIWHGDINNRQYLKRIKGFTGEAAKIKERDKNGLHVGKGKDRYVRQYYQEREVAYEEGYDFGGFDDGFYEDMGYAIADIIQMFGQPSYDAGAGVQDDQPVDALPFSMGGAGVASPSHNDILPFSQGGAGVQDNQPNNFLPFSQGGAGVTDDGRHVITDDMLQGATITGPSDELATAIHHASQPDVPDPVAAPDAPADADDGNFS